MDISFLSEFMMPVIVGICLCVGYVIKKWVKDVDNKYIPTICAVLGVALSVWVHWPAVSPEAILIGMFLCFFNNLKPFILNPVML